jgi:hypothetical protein
MAMMKFNSGTEQAEVEAKVRELEKLIQMGPREISKRVEYLKFSRRMISESLRLAETPEEILPLRERLEEINTEIQALRRG